MKPMTRNNSIESILCLLSVNLAYWPVWRWYLARMLDGSDEPWGLFALLTACIFVLIKGKPRAPKRFHVFVATGVLLFYTLSYQYLPDLVRGFLMILTLGTLLSTMLSKERFHLGLLGLLVLSLPLIASLQFYAGYPLRLVTTYLASEGLNVIGVLVEQQGTSLLWTGEVISVDAPCSGVKMLWAGLYLAFTLSCFLGLNTKNTWLSYLGASVLIFVANVVRTTVLFFVEAKPDLFPESAHQWIGLLIFMLSSFFIIQLSLFFEREQCAL